MPDQPVPYQAYRSKRHSRVHSTGSPLQSPNSRLVTLEAPTTPPRPPVVNGQPRANGTALQPEPVASPQSQSQIESPRSPTSPAQSEPEAGPSTVPAVTQQCARSEASPKATPRKTTTFRRVPLNKPHPPLPGSPLGSNRPTVPHSRGLSTSSIPPLSISGAPPLSSSASAAPWPLTPSPAAHLQQLTAISTLSIQPAVLPTSNQSSSSLSVGSTSNSAPSSRPQSSSGVTRQGEESTQPIRTVTRTPAPYRPGFQPKGVYRPLTDDFLALRQVKQDGDGKKRVERTKLERRLEKLIALHFPMPPTVSEKALQSRRTSTSDRRSSSFFEFDLKNIQIADAGSLWKNVIHAVEGNGKIDIRAEEQRITPWDEDSSTSRCPLCSASFHPLTNRKHHCRLCGKIVCSLPIKRPQRPTPCSTLFVVDSKTRKIEEVGEGVDYGVRRKRPSTGANGITKIEDEEDRFLKGVRVCRECRPVLLRQQYLQEILLVPPFVKLYEVFLLLEKDIENTLSQYQEFILNSSLDTQPTKEALIVRKRLLEAFAQYDALSKQIRSLRCPRGSGSSSDRVQAAILTRASIFLQKNMLPLQSLPTPSRGVKPSTAETPKVDRSSQVARILQPLLEQEALLEGFIEEASAQRKFEDVKSLKVNLLEIRAEIEKIVAVEEADLDDKPRPNGNTI